MLLTKLENGRVFSIRQLYHLHTSNNVTIDFSVLVSCVIVSLMFDFFLCAQQLVPSDISNKIFGVTALEYMLQVGLFILLVVFVLIVLFKKTATLLST